jgi:fructokinase
MIATLGEALVDLIEQQDGRFDACLGGSVCNFTQALALQGMDTAYVNPLSADKFGRRFHTLLTGHGVHLATARTSTRPTALAIVSLDERGSPTYAFHRDSVADRDISAAELIAALPDPCQLLHTGGLALTPADLDKTLEVVRAAAAKGTLISIDANLRPVAVDDPAVYVIGVRQALSLAQIIKVSDEDLLVLGLDPYDLDAVATLLEPAGVQLIALTRGASGALLMTRQHRITLPAPPHLTIVDTVGAGDCFQAGLIACLARAGRLDSVAALADLDPALLHTALSHALAAASINVTRAGCNPATWEETVAFQRQ